MTSALFEDDSAEVDAILEAVNGASFAGGAFERDEVEAALREMDKANNIM